MTICKFYLQGNCRFGNSCRFEHQLNNHQHSSILRQHSQNVVQPPTYNTQPSANSDVNILVRAVIQDAANAEKGGQWLLSAYGPFKERPNFPGFEDLSPEEVRYEFVQAQANGTVDQYKYGIETAIQDVKNKLRHLQSPTAEIIEIIKQLNLSTLDNNLTTSNQPSSATNPFGTIATNSFSFNQNVQQPPHANSIFNTQQPPSQSIFTNSNMSFNNAAANPMLPTQNAFQFNQSPPAFPTQVIPPAPISCAQNIFGANMPIAQMQQPNNQIDTDPIYSTVQDLTENEVRLYQAENFEFGLIPEKPPIREMCL